MFVLLYVFVISRFFLWFNGMESIPQSDAHHRTGSEMIAGERSKPRIRKLGREKLRDTNDGRLASPHHDTPCFGVWAVVCGLMRRAGWCPRRGA